MGMVYFPFLLMVVDQFNVKDVIPFKAENDAPVGPHRHGPEAPQITFERVQPIAGKVERLWPRGLIETGKNILDRFQQIGPYQAPVAALLKAFQAPMLEARDHHAIL